MRGTLRMVGSILEAFNPRSLQRLVGLGELLYAFVSASSMVESR
jgi:hypothetical protein